MENGHPVVRIKRSSTDDKWIGRNETEGWRFLREKPAGTPKFVSAHQIDEMYLTCLDQIFSLLSSPEARFEWESIREDSTSIVSGPYMTEDTYHWLECLC